MTSPTSTAPSRTLSRSPPIATVTEELDAAVAELVAAVRSLDIARARLGTALAAIPDRPPLTEIIGDAVDNFSIAAPQKPSLKEEIVTKRCPVLLVGESETRALPFALAVMRGSLKGIRATCFHHSGCEVPCLWRDDPPVNINDAIGRTRARIDENNIVRHHLDGQDDTLPPYGRIIDDLNNFHLADGAIDDLTGELDATKLRNDILPKLDMDDKRPLVIWFQCPWSFYKEQGYTTAELLSRFLVSASTLDAPGGIILVLGLVPRNSYNDKDYTGEYQIESLKQIAREKNFEHFEDRKFIRECILYGYRYRHWNESEWFHDQFLVHHVSHVFFKK